MKERMKRLLLELVRDSSRSDRELAKALGYSQPAISRMKQRLAASGAIREFTAVPDFPEIGYEIMAITIGKASPTLSPDQQEKARALVFERANVIFAGSARGMGSNGVLISLHKNYSGFLDFIANLESKSEGYMENVDTVLISLKSDGIVKPLSIATLAKATQA